MGTRRLVAYLQPRPPLSRCHLVNDALPFGLTGILETRGDFVQPLDVRRVLLVPFERRIADEIGDNLDRVAGIALDDLFHQLALRVPSIAGDGYVDAEPVRTASGKTVHGIHQGPVVVK